MSNVDVTRDAPPTIHAPIDTSVALPTGVLAAKAKAEALHKAAYNPDPAGAPAPAPVAAPDGAPGGQPPAPKAPAPQPAPVPPPSVDTLAQPEPGAPDDGSYEHKFKSQQGRMAAMGNQMRSMQQQMSEMGNELIAAQNTIQQLRAVPRPVPGGTPAPSLITDKDRADFGDDFLDAAARAGQQRITPEVAAVRAEVNETRQELHQIKVGRVWDALNAQIGAQWQNINRHPSFLAWLSLRDPMSGAMRKTLLDGAMQAADAARVVNIFRGFLADDAASRPAAPAVTAPAAPATPAAPKAPTLALETLAAPGRASAAPGSPPAVEKPIYTNADIRTFYDAVRKGAYAGRQPEKDAIEADIFAAQREGRVHG